MSGTLSGGFGAPYQQQFAPQGLFGDIFGKLAGPAGGAIGNLLGHQQLGNQIGNFAGQFSRFIPFSAGPQMAGQAQDGQQQLDPQSLASLVAMIRQAATYAQQGAQVLHAVHQAAPGLLPFALGADQQQQQQAQPQAAGQQLDPQGLFGSILSKIAGPAGSFIGGKLGNAGLGQRIGSTAGTFANFLPFSAGPQQAAPQQDGQQQLDPQSLASLVAMIRQAATYAQQGAQVLHAVHQAAPGLLPFALGADQQQQQQAQPQAAGQQLDPQGLFGSILSKIAGPAGSFIGGKLGNAGLGQRIGSTAGTFANFLPFAAGPQQAGQAQDGQQQLDPQFLGGLVTLIRQAAQAAQQGAQVLHAVHQAAPGLLPFALGPDQQQQQAQADAQQQLDPQGLFGSILSKIAGPAGSAIGHLVGHQQAGSTIGNTVGRFANFLPFSAGPQGAGQDQQLDPQSLFSGLITRFPFLNGKSGIPGFAPRIGTTEAPRPTFLPFSAGPEQGAQPQAGQPQDGQQQLDPQSLASLVAMIRQAAQAAQQGAQVLNAVHQAAPGLLPFALGADQQQQQQAQAGAQQLDPQGLFGSILSKIAGPAGSAIGHLVGHQQAGSTIGNTVGHFANFLPFAAGPQAGAQG